MTYPQPDADIAVVKGGKFFRLFTLLESPGDIYESAQGANAMCIGPESDISEVAVAYYDPTQPTNISQLVVGNDRAFVGLLNVNVADPYAYLPAQRPGKILMWPNNLWNPDFVPNGGTLGPTVTQILETPILDVLQYFGPQSSLTPQRRDKTYTYQEVVVPDGEGSVAYITVPFYGRKYASIRAVHFSGPQGGVNIAVYGNTLTYGDQAGGTSTSGFSTVLAQQNPIGSGYVYQAVVTAGGVTQVQDDGGGTKLIVGMKGGGAFDLLSVGLTRLAAPAGVNPVFVEITVSDSPIATSGPMAIVLA